MKSLQELAQVIEDYKLDNVSTFNVFNRKESNSLYNKFLDGVASGAFHTDEEAAKHLYGTDSQGVKYRVLKNRLKQRVYNNIMFMDSGKPSSNSYYQTWVTLYRQLVAAKFLVGVSAKTAGMELANKVMKKAEAYELHDIVQQCAILFRRNSMLKGDLANFELYSIKLKAANELLMAELEAEEAYYLVLINFNKSLAVKKELLDLCRRSADKLSSLNRKFNTYLTNFYENGIETIYYQLINDYRAAIVSCNKFESYLMDSKIFFSNTRLGNLLVTKASCYLNLAEYEPGIEMATKAQALYAQGSENWFAVKELEFLLILNSERLEEATTVYLDVTLHERFEFQRPQLQESWKVSGGYLWFMLKYRKLEAQLDKLRNKRKEFRYAKLLNEIPHYSKDKKGMNVAVLILQILLLIETQDYSKIIEKSDALKSYLNRNVTKDDAIRSYYFINMLLAIERLEFDLPKIEKETKPMLKNLKEGGPNHATTQAKMEVISYETLWNVVLDLLQNQNA